MQAGIQAMEDEVASPSRPLSVVIHAVASQMGGGVTVAAQLTEALARLAPQHRFILFAASDALAATPFPANVQVINLPGLASRLKRWLWEQLTLPGECKRHGADVVLCLGGFTMFTSRIPQVAVWQNPNTYVSGEFHRPLTLELYIWLQSVLQGLSMRKAAQNVFLTDTSMQGAATRWNLRALPHVAIHSGIDEDRIVVDAPPDLSTREPYIVTIGHAYFHKNYEALIDAMAAYRERHGDPPILDILGGPFEPGYFETLKQRVKERGLEGIVRMDGAVPSEVVTERLARARLYVVTSVLETFGLTMFEAMGAGLPVVASRATCHPEVCGDAAHYCDPNDPADIADRIHEVMADPELARGLQQRGMARVREFSWDKSARAYLAEIEAAAARPA